jgi:hypothetical protein
VFFTPAESTRQRRSRRSATRTQHNHTVQLFIDAVIEETRRKLGAFSIKNMQQLAAGLTKLTLRKDAAHTLAVAAGTGASRAHTTEAPTASLACRHAR